MLYQYERYQATKQLQIYKKKFTPGMFEENLQMKIQKKKFTPVMFEEKFQMKIYNTVKIALKTDSDAKYKCAYRRLLGSQGRKTLVSTDY